jgi:apolipoprotein N-acyltransferase
MKIPLLSPLIKNRTSLLGGILLALSMPGMRLTPLAPIALILYYRTALSGGGYTAGFLFGFSFFLLSLSWIPFPVHVYGGVPTLLAIFPLLLLSGYCALYFSLPLGIFRRLREKPSFSEGWYPLILALLVSGAEEVRGWLLTGFPWNPLALSLTSSHWLLLPARSLSSTGVGFLLLWFSFSIYHAFWKRRSIFSLQVLGSLAIAFLSSLPLERGPERTLRYAVIQGNIPQDVKWTREYQTLTLQIYEDLTRQATALTPSPDLILWPETAAPFYFQEPGSLHLWVRKIAENASAPLLFGAPAYEVTSDGVRESNRAYLLNERGEVVGFYDKVHLVPFGEYVPLGKLLFFVHRLARGIGEFLPGKSRYPLEVKNLKMGVLICYEAIFPYEVREFALRGADLLVQITNDAWFGPTWAPEQHLELARLRAIELGVPLFRSANTGISAVISPEGRIVQRTPIFTRTYLTGSLHYHPFETFYKRFGGIIAWIFRLFFLLPFGFLFGRELLRFHPVRYRSQKGVSGESIRT